MKRILILLLFVHPIRPLLAQNGKAVKEKPPVDFNAIESWPSVGDAAISGNGQYALYYVNNQPVHSRTLVVVSTKNNWKKEVVAASDAVFSDNSKKVVFKTTGDSLCILVLGSNMVEHIPGIKSFKLFLQGKTEYLLYHLNNQQNVLVLKDIEKGITKRFSNVENYFVSKNGNALLLQSKKDIEKNQTLSWVQLPGGDGEEIWQGKGAGNFVFDNAGQQLAFVVEQTVNGKVEQVFWYYKNGISKAVLLADNRTPGIDSGYTLNGIDRFSTDGSKLFFKQREPDFPKPKSGAVMVNVWSYLDLKLQSQQIAELTPDRWGDGGPKSYLSAIKVDNKRIIRLQQENESLTLFDGRSDEWGIITHVTEDHEYWNKYGQPTQYLISVKTGRRKKVEMRYADWSSLGMSPNSKYIILQNGSFNDLFSYEVETGIVRPMTKNLPIPLIDEDIDWTRPVRGICLAAWTEDNKLLAYDSFDIWLLDPTGKDLPDCLTNGQGRRHNLIFRLSGNIIYRDKLIGSNERLVLSVFNKKNKDNGFYSIIMGKKANPKLLTMGAYAYYHPTIDAGFPMQPVKAKYANTWLLERENSSESPNLFVTTDFIGLRQLSAVYPEKLYNWFTTKLITYRTLDGRQSQGILYSPQNLDTTKKNPVIIYYYEKLSQHLNDYKAPEFSPGWMDISYFASQGYVVFTPDIHFEIGHHAESTCNSVIGGAKDLMKLSWIDSIKMGIQGHSMGGFETNNIITHTNIFAAACTAAGTSDLISHSGLISTGVDAKGSSEMTGIERGQYRMGAILWQRPDLYIDNSPIFNVNAVTTPVLIMHNALDGAVPFTQSIEFFTALRRLGKRAWMLQYDGELHSLIQKANSMDYTIRMKQFFDYYLRDSLPPKWMTRGIPAKMKGIDDGLEFDNEIKVPSQEGLLTSEEKKRLETLQKKKPITITIN